MDMNDSGEIKPLHQLITESLDVLTSYRKFRDQSSCKYSRQISTIEGNSQLFLDMELLKGKLHRRDEMIKTLRRFLLVDLLSVQHNGMPVLPTGSSIAINSPTPVISGPVAVEYMKDRVKDMQKKESDDIMKLLDEQEVFKHKINEQQIEIDAFKAKFLDEIKFKSNAMHSYTKGEIKYRDKIKALEIELRGLKSMASIRNSNLDQEKLTVDRLSIEIELLHATLHDNKRKHEMILNETIGMYEQRLVDEAHVALSKKPQIVKEIVNIEPSMEKVDAFYRSKYGALVVELDNLVEKGVFYPSELDRSKGRLVQYKTYNANKDVDVVEELNTHINVLESAKNELVTQKNELEYQLSNAKAYTSSILDKINEMKSMQAKLVDDEEYISSLRMQNEVLSSKLNDFIVAETERQRRQRIILKHFGTQTDPDPDPDPEASVSRKSTAINMNNSEDVVDCAKYANEEDSTHEIETHAYELEMFADFKEGMMAIQSSYLRSSCSSSSSNTNDEVAEFLDILSSSLEPYSYRSTAENEVLAYLRDVVAERNDWCSKNYQHMGCCTSFFACFDVMIKSIHHALTLKSTTDFILLDDIERLKQHVTSLTKSVRSDACEEEMMNIENTHCNKTLTKRFSDSSISTSKIISIPVSAAAPGTASYINRLLSPRKAVIYRKLAVKQDEPPVSLTEKSTVSALYPETGDHDFDHFDSKYNTATDSVIFITSDNTALKSKASTLATRSMLDVKIVGRLPNLNSPREKVTNAKLSY